MENLFSAKPELSDCASTDQQIKTIEKVLHLILILLAPEQLGKQTNTSFISALKVHAHLNPELTDHHQIF